MGFNPTTGAITGIPTTSGIFTFTLRATNVAGQANQGASISIAVPVVSVISLSANSLDFGNQNVDTTSAPCVVTVSNTGNGPFDVRSITGIGNFAFSGNCAGTLSPGANGAVTVTFTPIAAGSRSGLIGVSTTAQAGDGSIALAGNGVAVPRANIAINPGNLVFGDQAVGTSSAALAIYISNTGLAALELRNLTTTGSGFNQSSPSALDNPHNHPVCGAGNVFLGASCILGISFAPVATGNVTGSLVITHNSTPNGGQGTSTVDFTGKGTSKCEAIISVSSRLSFIDQVLGTTSVAQIITVGNTGTINININGIRITPTNANTGEGNFNASSGCGTLAPNANCNISVSFSPSGTVGIKTANLNIDSNATNASAGAVGLSGNAIPIPATLVRLSATSIGFGNIILGGATPSQVVTLTNKGGEVLNITNIAIAGDFAQSNTCGTTVAAQASCVVNVVFTPGVPGGLTGELIITSDAVTSPNRVQLSGTGCRWFSQSQ